MQISYKWLLEHVPYTGDIEHLCDVLSLTGTKVETISQTYAEINGVVVGKIIKLDQHPNADRLKVCQIDLGGEVLQILTAAENVSEGDLVPVARIGANLNGGLQIKKTKMRGLPSEGMLCSIEELGLTPDDFPEAPVDGIFILPDTAVLGQDVMDYLGLRDYSIDFEITPNRPDCLSFTGLARELAVSFDLPFNEPDTNPSQAIAKGLEQDQTELKLSLKDQTDCSQYAGWIIDQVQIGPSPTWLRQYLRASGVRPINNIVDITNYVMLVTGNPLHAFDFDQIKQAQITVRRAEQAEKLKTLDGVERQLSPDDLVVADGQRALALAGVMGGEDSEITPETKTVFLEIANFNPDLIRQTSRKFALRSDASTRFERGVDPASLVKARGLALKLIFELGVGKPRQTGFYAGSMTETARRVEFKPEAINSLLGLELDEQKMVDILTKLGFELVADLGRRFIEVPSWRPDVDATADLAEEVARFVGYNSIPARLNSGRIVEAAGRSESQKREAKIRQVCLACGAYECKSSPFASRQDFIDLGMGDKIEEEALPIINPLGQERAYMASSLLPRLLEHIELNQHEKLDQIFFFEIARSFKKATEDQGLPRENRSLSLILYSSKLTGKDLFLKLKGVLDLIAKSLHLPEWTYQESDQAYYQPGQASQIMVGKDQLGSLGGVHPDLLERKDVKPAVVFAELNLSKLLDLPAREFNFVRPSRFPAVERDLAIVAPRNFPAGEIARIIESAGGKYLSELELFDHYEGERIDPTLKSLAYGLRFRSDQGTMNDKDIDRQIDKILRALEEQGLSLRE